MTACADAPAPPDEGPPNSAGTPLPDVAEIVCEPDRDDPPGTAERPVQPDGVHVHVDVSLKEPVHVDGLLLDEEVQPGETDS